MATGTAPFRHTSQRANRRAFALLMVVAVVAIASVLGFVMLAGATVQGRASANHTKLLSADYLAESGLNLAMYYLQRPENAPSLNASGYWGGSSTQYTLPNGLPCTLEVSVERDATDSWTYEVRSFAAVGHTSANRITRTSGARVQVQSEYVLRHAGVFNNNTTLNGPMIFNGDVWSSKQLGLKVGLQTPYVSGSGYCQTAITGVGWAQPAGGFKAASGSAQAGPSNADVNLYQTYELDDVTYNASNLGSTSLTGSVGVTTLTSSPSNPAGIWFRDGSSGSALTLNDNVTINGTLVVTGDLLIKGQNIFITPQPGFPALIVTGTMEIFQESKSITVNGVCYVGKGLKSNGTPSTMLVASTFNVNGGLMLGTTSDTPVQNSYNVKTTVTYDAVKAQAPEMTTVLRTPKGVNVVRWGLP